jgi:molecular chaperone DnaK
MKADDLANLKAKMDALMKEMSAVSTRIYQAAAAQHQSAQQQAPPPGEDKKDEGKGDFTDADYHIVD